jgi:hypothetical protein
MKTSHTPKHKLAAWRHDRNLVTFWHHYDKLFVKDGLLYRSLKTKNTHPGPAIVVPKALETELQSLQVSEPFTFWALDYMGPLPETNRGNKHIFPSCLAL